MPSTSVTVTPAEDCHEGAGAEMLAHQPAVLERHPVGFGELQVGDAARRLRRHLPALGVTVLIEAGEPEEAVLALHRDIRPARRRSEKKSSMSNS